MIYAVLLGLGFFLGKWVGAITLPLSYFILTNKNKLLLAKKMVSSMDDYPKTFFSLMGYTAGIDGNILPAHDLLVTQSATSFQKGCSLEKIKAWFLEGHRMSDKKIHQLLVNANQRYKNKPEIRKTLVETAYVTIIKGYGQTIRNERFLMQLCRLLDLDYQLNQTELNQRYHEMSVDYFFKVLGLSSQATKEEVIFARKKLMGQYHPDKLVGATPEEKEKLNQKVNQINQAYQKIKHYKGF